jgi:transcriptional regulator with XRE-family HTH domain
MAGDRMTGKDLRRRRTALKRSVDEVAVNIGCSSNTIYKLEIATKFTYTAIKVKYIALLERLEAEAAQAPPPEPLKPIDWKIKPRVEAAPEPQHPEKCECGGAWMLDIPNWQLRRIICSECGSFGRELR